MSESSPANRRTTRSSSRQADPTRSNHNENRNSSQRSDRSSCPRDMSQSSQSNQLVNSSRRVNVQPRNSTTRNNTNRTSDISNTSSGSSSSQSSDVCLTRNPILLDHFEFTTGRSNRGYDATYKHCSSCWQSGKPDRLKIHVVRFPRIDANSLEYFKMNCPNIDDVMKSVAREDRIARTYRMLVEFIATSDSSLNIVMNGEFIKFVQYLEPEYKLPCPKTLRERLLTEHADVVFRQGIDTLNRARNHITLEFDGWSSNSYHLIALTATNYMGRSFLLGLVDLGEERATASVIATRCDDCLTACGLEKTKIISIVTDEA